MQINYITHVLQFTVMDSAAFKNSDLFVASNKKLDLMEIIFGKHEAINSQFWHKVMFEIKAAVWCTQVHSVISS